MAKGIQVPFTCILVGVGSKIAPAENSGFSVNQERQRLITVDKEMNVGDHCLGWRVLL